MKKIENLPQSYEYDKNGFIRQKEHDHFNYTLEYKKRQGTNVEMCYLRLGWLSSFFSYEKMKEMNVVDIGCGSGIFVKCCTGKFKRIVGYDLVGESISEKELHETDWNLVVLSDVLEHFEDIEDLFKMKWHYAMISFPETPKFETFEEMKSWRHFKPNEHLYYLNINNVIDWFWSHDKEYINVMGIGNFEDLIRTRWNEEKTNISTLLVSRKCKNYL